MMGTLTNGECLFDSILMQEENVPMKYSHLTLPVPFSVHFDERVSNHLPLQLAETGLWVILHGYSFGMTIILIFQTANSRSKLGNRLTCICRHQKNKNKRCKVSSTFCNMRKL